MELPRGVSSRVKEAAVALVRTRGAETLEQYAKMHFKTASEVLESAAGL
jgi:ribonuclease HIII